MSVHIRVHHWVIWWFWLGVVFGAVALVNILVRDLPRTEDRVVLLVSALFWVIGGVFCFALEGVKLESRSDWAGRRNSAGPRLGADCESHAASDFLLPGTRKSLLPFRH